MSNKLHVCIVGLLTISLCGNALATNYDEGIDGDLSGDRLNPTNRALTLGSNIVSASSIGNPTPDREYLHWSLSPGLQISQIQLQDFVGGGDDVAFIGVQAGTQLTEPAVGANVANILGYVHMGEMLQGTDILDNMGAGAGAIGFTPPLSGTDYTFWMQQTGSGITSTYTLNFVVVPEPTSLGLLGVAAIGWMARRARGRCEERLEDSCD